jgi:hypothetical protein
MLLPMAVMAAKPVAPPSVHMTGEGRSVVVGTVLMTPEDANLSFRIEAVLAGEEVPGEKVTVRGKSASEFSTVVAGRPYVIAFTRLASTDQFRDAKFIDPDGPSVLHLRGIQVPMVFADAPALRFLVTRARGEDQPTDRERLDAVVALMDSAELRTRAFAIEELYIRDELPPVFEYGDVDAVRRAMARPGLPVQLVQFLLESAQRAPGGPAAPWLYEESLRYLRSLGPNLDLVTAEPLVVRTALKSVAAAADASALPLVLPLIASNSPPIVRQALELADSMNPQLTLAAVQQRMEAIVLEEDVHADALRALEQYLVGRSLPVGETR